MYVFIYLLCNSVIASLSRAVTWYPYVYMRTFFDCLIKYFSLFIGGFYFSGATSSWFLLHSGELFDLLSLMIYWENITFQILIIIRLHFLSSSVLNLFYLWLCWLSWSLFLLMSRGIMNISFFVKIVHTCC